MLVYCIVPFVFLFSYCHSRAGGNPGGRALDSRAKPENDKSKEEASPLLGSPFLPPIIS